MHKLTGTPTTTFYDLTVTSTTTAISDYNVSHNFTNTGTYDGTIGTLTMTGSLPSIITGSTASFNLAQVTNQKTAGVTNYPR